MRNLMCELVEAHEQRSDCAGKTFTGTRQAVRFRQDRLWAATSIALVLGLLALSFYGIHEMAPGTQPSDQQLTADFLAHETSFDELVELLATSYPSRAAKRAAAVDLAAIARSGTGGVRLGKYGRLLRQIAAADFRYFPDSGTLILVPDGEEDPDRPSRSYVYLPHARPQSFIQHHEYYWRGPGVDILTGDVPLKAGWFIRHDIAVEVAITPY